MQSIVTSSTEHEQREWDTELMRDDDHMTVFYRPIIIPYNKQNDV